MSKRKYKKGIKSIKKEIDTHRNIKLKQAVATDNSDLAHYYAKEIERLENQLEEKEKKLLPRRKRMRRNKTP